MTDTRPALVVDGMSILRSVAGPAASLTNGYAYSFVVQLTAAMKKAKPKGVFICWEGGYTKRLEVDPNYKKDRNPTPPAIRGYRDEIKHFLQVSGCDQLVAPGYEADDVGALLANTLGNVVLFSNDKDWLQLVRPGVSLYQKVRGTGLKQERKMITAENFSKLTGWSTPQQFLKAHCAMGDAVDSVPGVFGVGPTSVHSYLNGIKLNAGLTKKLDDFYAGADYERNMKLICLTDIRELPVETTFGELNERAVLNLLTDWGFSSMCNKFDTWITPYREASL